MSLFASPSQKETQDGVRSALRDSLQIGTRANALRPSSRLLGAIPELDSMAVATLLAALEERFDITLDDEDVSAAHFKSFKSLCDLIDDKRR